MRRVVNAWIVAASAALLPAARAYAQGCAMCGNSFTPDDPVTGAMNTSVIFLLLMPYTLLAGVAGWLYLRHRQGGPRRRADVIELPWARAGAQPASGPEKE